MTEPDLTAAAEAIESAADVVRGATRKLAETGSVDVDQILAYDLAHAAAAVETARSMLDYGAKGPIEAELTLNFSDSGPGTDVAATFNIRGSGWYAVPAFVADKIAVFAVLPDLRRAAQILASKPR